MGPDSTGRYLCSDGCLVEHQGSDSEALAIAGTLLQQRAGDGSLVQAVSVGCPAEIQPVKGRLLVVVRKRPDRRGWMLEGDLMSGTWHRSLEHAVGYGAFRTLGYESETRIVNGAGQITHVVLIPGGQRRMTLY